MVSTTFGHYRLDARIGEGGMGEVFRAFDTRLNRPVALKVLRQAREDHQEAVVRFLREARAASALNHPNIVIVHEVGETEAGSPFIVQEFIEGQTLRSMLREPLPPEAIADLGGQIARALAAAHAAGIVHRDIKPENIMIRADGFVKVLDFGIARRTPLDASQLATTHTTEAALSTAPGTLLGTPAYMAPEQVRGEELGPAVDVFALGVVLYEMATARRPFTGSTPLGVVAAVLSEQPVPPSRIDRGISAALDELLLQMLDKDPARRPSAQEVERQLTVRPAAFPLETQPARAALDRTTVGREHERRQLRQAYRRVQDDRSLMIGVAGEPGIGKTSLIEDFLAELTAGTERPTVARGRCSESLAGAEAYLPILDVLDGLLRRTDGPSLVSLMRTVAPTWYSQLATTSVEALWAGAELREPAPATSPERMKRELSALFHEVSRLRPLVVFIDDLHWADVSTIDLLNYQTGRFDDMRLLVLVSYRPSDMALAKHPFLNIRNDLQSRGLFEEIALPFLAADDVARYLSVQFPAHAFPRSFAEAIHARTEGSPLFIVDLVRYLRDTGGIVREDGTWVVARGVPHVSRDLPESVRGMIARKIEQIDEVDRRLLLAASVQGHEFDSATVADAAGMSAGEVEDRLEALERVHVLVTRGEEDEFPDRTLTVRYRFVHVLYQNVLFASLQPTRRARIASQVARGLVTRHGADTAGIVGRLAVLYEMARDFAASARYFFAAAQRAVGVFGFREALSLADRGLDGLRALPDGPERQQLELGLQMIRGLALRSVKGWAAPELEPTFARARQLCQQLENPPELFPVLWNLTFFHMIRGNLEIVREQTATLMAQAEASGEPALRMAVHHVAGVSQEFIGDLAESHRLLERARELHDPAEHPAYNAMFGIDPGMVARAMSSRPLWSLGYPDRAIARCRETNALARSQRQPVTLVFALVVTQGIHLYRGEYEAVLAMGDEIIALCDEYEFPQEAEWSRVFQGSARAASAGRSQGIAQLQSSLAALQALRSGLVRTVFLGLLADALRLDGRIAEGLAAVDEAAAHAEKHGERGFLAELHRARGELLLAGGDVEAAERSLRAAIDRAREQGARSFELRAATACARALVRRSRRSEAQAVLEPVLAWFTEGQDTIDLRTASALLAEIG
jgi:serine/threonine protein kinase/predicted ATPase